MVQEGKEGQVEQPSQEQPVVEVQPEAQTKTFTQEEMDTLFDEKYKTIQRTLSKKDQEIARLSKQGTQTSKTPLDAIATALEAQGIPTDGIRAEAQRQDQIEKMDAYANGERQRLSQKIVDAGLDPSDSIFDDAWESFEMTNKLDGEFSRVDKRVDKIIGSAKPEDKVEPKGTLEDLDKAIEERAREKLEKEGQLSAEPAVPSGGAVGQTYTVSELKNMGPKEYRKAFPAVTDLLKAQSEGRIVEG